MTPFPARLCFTVVSVFRASSADPRGARKLLPPGIVLAGFVPPLEVNPMLWTYKQLKIVGILGAPAGVMNIMGLSMYLIAHRQIDPRPLVTEVIPLKDCQRAIDSVYSGSNIAVLLKP